MRRGGLCDRRGVEGRATGRGLLRATHQGAELDLLLLKDGRRLGIEIKRMDAPVITPSIRIALEDLKLEQLVVLYPGKSSYPLSDRVTVMPLTVIGQGDMEAIFPRRNRRTRRKPRMR